MSEKDEVIYEYQPLWGNWYIDLPVGKGSFGSVYKLKREDMGHQYTSAVKIISIPTQEQYKDAEATIGNDEKTLSNYFEDIVNNIVKEINVLYSLSGNSNVINYQDHMIVRREHGIGWDVLIKMEYVTSLRKYLSDHQMTKGDVIRLGRDICKALELCSTKGIVHRDIKDENIFVNEEGLFKLGDFGIARELSKSGRAMSMRGTPLYMAPEVMRGEKYDASVDIYALGLLMYKLLNHGRMPFMPHYPNEIRYKHSEEALERRLAGEPLTLPAQAEDILGEIILKACAFKAENRYQSATEFSSALLNAETMIVRTNLNGDISAFNAKNKHLNKSDYSTDANMNVTIGLFNESINEIIADDENTKTQSLFENIKYLENGVNLANCEAGITKQQVIEEFEAIDKMSEGSQAKKLFKSKNTKSRYFGIAIVCLLIFGAFWMFTFKESSLAYKFENAQSNLMNLGYAAFDNGWIYYTTNDKLYKMKQDGSNNQLLSETGGYFINVVNEWIYYETSKNGLSKVRTDGTDYSVISFIKDAARTGMDIGDYYVNSKWIYYKRWKNNESSLVRVALDGTNEQIILSDSIYRVSVVGDYIYYSNEKGLYKIDLNGLKKEIVVDVPSMHFVVDDNWIYYSQGDYENFTLKKIMIDGTNDTNLNLLQIQSFNVIGEWLYYSSQREGESGLYRIKTNGTEWKKISNSDCFNINIVGDWIFYYSLSSRSYNKIKIDGTKEQMIN